MVNQRSRRDQEALLEAQAQSGNLKARMTQTQEQLEREVQKSKHLEEQRDRLEERLGRVGEDRVDGQGSGPLHAEGHSVSTRLLPSV